MPIYEYQCAKCDHSLEALQKVSDPELAKCPQCGELSLKRLVSAAGFRLKGTGWYVTDFKSGSKSGSDKSASADSTSVGTSKAKSSDSTKDKAPKKQSKD